MGEGVKGRLEVEDGDLHYRDFCEYRLKLSASFERGTTIAGRFIDKLLFSASPVEINSICLGTSKFVGLVPMFKLLNGSREHPRSADLRTNQINELTRYALGERCKNPEANVATLVWHVYLSQCCMR